MNWMPTKQFNKFVKDCLRLFRGAKAAPVHIMAVGLCGLPGQRKLTLMLRHGVDVINLEVREQAKATV